MGVLQETGLMSDIILKIQPNLGRRIFSILVLCICAVVIMNNAFSNTMHSMVLKLTLFGLGVAFLWQAQASFRFANAALILKHDGLYDDQDNLICSLSNIALVDRGWFSLKPSNGFLLRLHEPQSRKWLPGLYWRFGRRLGVGGALSPVQTKEMSDKLILLMQEKKLGIALL